MEEMSRIFQVCVFRRNKKIGGGGEGVGGENSIFFFQSFFFFSSIPYLQLSGFGQIIYQHMQSDRFAFPKCIGLKSQIENATDLHF